MVAARLAVLIPGAGSRPNVSLSAHAHMAPLPAAVLMAEARTGQQEACPPSGPAETGLPRTSTG
jgi:hypothetical protein